jgi:hypothetical protein
MEETMSTMNDRNERTPTRLQAKDVKELVYNQGRATINGRSFVLKQPSATDSALQSIVKDHDFTVRHIDGQPEAGGASYELNGNGKTVTIKIAC